MAPLLVEDVKPRHVHLLPEVERTRVIQQLTRGMSSKHHEAIINYFKNVANAQK